MKRPSAPTQIRLLRISALLWLCTIWFLSSLPAKDLPKVDIINFDKMAHATVYLILTVLVFLNFRTGAFGKLSRHEVLLILVLLCALEEAHQSFIPARQVSVLDLSANLFGILTGFFAHPLPLSSVTS